MKKLYLVTGFLGSGKTTFLNNIINTANEEKIAVIVNEFGSVGVDGTLLKENTVEVKEINNGSIFCSCKSADFIDALKEIKDLDFKYVFIETSGFSSPGNMDSIVDTVNRISGAEYYYMGMITLVQSSNFYKLYETVNAIKDQIIGSDLIIINKIDVSTQEDLNRTLKIIYNVNPEAEIIYSEFANVEFEKLKDLSHNKKNEEISKTVVKDITLQKLYFELDEDIDLAYLKNIIKEIAKETYRIKGFVHNGKDTFYIDCVGDDLKFTKTKSEVENNYIIVLGKNLDKVKFFLKNKLFYLKNQ